MLAVDISAVVLVVLFTIAFLMVKNVKLGFGSISITDRTFPSYEPRHQQHNQVLDEHINREFN